MTVQPDNNDKRLNAFADLLSNMHESSFDALFEDLGPKATLKKIKHDTDEIHAMANPFDKVTRLTIMKSDADMLEKKMDVYLAKKADNKNWPIDYGMAAVSGAGLGAAVVGLGLVLGLGTVLVYPAIIASPFVKRALKIKDPKFITRWKDRRTERNFEKLVEKWQPFYAETAELKNRIVNLHSVIMEHPDYSTVEKKAVQDQLKKIFQAVKDKKNDSPDKKGNTPSGPDTPSLN